MKTYSRVARTARIARILSSLCLFLSACAHAVDLKVVEQELGTTGAEGWVHGASAGQGLFAFTYRNPDNFFDFVIMSLVPSKPEIHKQLEELSRHDKVRIKGSFLPNPSPQKHVEVTAVEMVKKFAPPYPVPGYDHEAKVPDELLGRTDATFLVHAIHGEGHILVVEYKDTIVPIFVRDTELAKDLFRGDVVHLEFTVRKYPDRPTHLRLNETSPQAVRVLEPIREKHGKAGSVEGSLVLFPKSPEIMFNVFAVLEELPDGLKRQYTLVNFKDKEIFAKIRQKLQAAWDKHPKDYVNGRNKLVSTRVRVKATGTFNVVDPNQANPQILLDSPDSVEILD